MNYPRLAVCAAALLALAACNQRQNEAATAAVTDAVETARQADAAFDSEQQAWRDLRRAELTQPDGWTSLIGLHWIDPGAHYLGSSAGNGIRLAMGPSHLGMLDLKQGKLRFVPDRGTAVVLDGEPLKRSTTLLADDAPTGPAKLGFDDGKGIATVIKRGQRYALRVKHADAPTRTGFKGIDYWPGGSDWKLTGKFVAHPAGKTIPIANIIGTVDEVPNPGVVEFERDGKPYRIEALDQGGEGLFLVFADRTSGHGSYGAGRYLDAPRPDAQGHIALDFNQAYNPPCAFTAFATCPLPPSENRLDLAISAGEKNYHLATQ